MKKILQTFPNVVENIRCPHKKNIYKTLAPNFNIVCNKVIIIEINNYLLKPCIRNTVLYFTFYFLATFNLHALLRKKSVFYFAINVLHQRV